MDLVKLIRDCVQPYEKPAVYISGGLDSSIILHHLREKLPETKIYTYTIVFGTSTDETEKAQRVADHYKTTYLTIHINFRDFLDALPEIQKLFARPRFNIWPWFLAQAAKYDNRKTIYIGEGSDELFGGYHDRNYLEGWAGQLIYVRPTYETIHKYYNLDLETPFMDLPWTMLLDLHEPPNKQALRKAYKNILPDFVINTPSQPPAFCEYDEFLEGGKKELQKLTTKIWLEAHK